MLQIIATFLLFEPDLIFLNKLHYYYRRTTVTFLRNKKINAAACSVSECKPNGSRAVL